MIAVVGAGYWGPNLIRVLANHGLLSLIVETDATRRASIQEQYPHVRCTDSVAEALSSHKVQAVAIATPAASHASLTAQALCAGKDVFVEKPIALSVKEGKQLQELAVFHQRILMVGHLLHYHPAFCAIEERKAQLGALRYLSTERLSWGRVRHHETVLWSLAPHDIGLALQLFQQLPQRVSAQGLGWLRPHCPDIVSLQLSFPNAMMFSKISWLSPKKSQRLMLVGSKQSLLWEEQRPQSRLVGYETHQPSWEDTPSIATEHTKISLETREALEEELLHFVMCIQSRQTPRTNAAFAVNVLRVLEACEQSLANHGAAVSL